MDQQTRTGLMLDATTVRGRLRDYGLTAHMQIATMMMGGIFALAAITLVEILRNPDLRFMRLTFWLLGVGTEMVALARQMQRPLLLARASTTEIPFLVLHGLLTLAAFAVIAPQSGGPDNWRYVYLLWIGIGLSSSLIMQSSIRSMRSQAYAPGLQAVVDQFVTHQRAFMRQVLVGLTPFSIFMFLLVVFFLRGAIAEATVIAVNVLTLAWIAYSYAQHERDFRNFEMAVDLAAAAENG